jgi:integrase
MAHVRTRCGAGGQPRYTAYFHDARGRERSAGTYPLLREAREAAFDAQARVLDGRFLDRAAGRASFERYVTEVWLPSLSFEATTRQGYAYIVHKYLLEFFGPIRMSELMPGTVREFYALLSAVGVGGATVHKCKTVLCSIFNTAVNDRVVARHPCAGVPVPPEPHRLRTVISPGEYLAIRAHLPARWQLLTDLALDSACRWGELAELRVKDLDCAHCELRVVRTVVEIDAAHRPAGCGRFLVKDYPKNTHHRILALGSDLAARLTAMIEQRGACPQALLFPARAPQPDSVEPTPLAQRGDFTRGGRRFTHGTLYAYTVGVCRCQPCRAAIAAYRADRRAHGLDRPAIGRATTSADATGHVSRDWFRHSVWQPAVTAAEIGRPVTVLSRPGARLRCCHRSVSPGRSPNPACGLLRTGLSTVSAVRRGSWRAMGMGSCSPGRRSG